MKSSLLSHLCYTGLVAVLSVVLLPMLSAETFKGPVRLRGAVQNSARPGSISFTYQGKLKSASTGNFASVTGGGLFRSINKKIVNTSFKGELTSYTRYNATVQNPGKLVQQNRNVRIRVQRKIVRIPGAVIKLDKPIDGKLKKRQKIQGVGSFKHVRR